mmetsp:Transcript_9843/g.10342  ORF Transcript_9843/g.10342 Transcript_9843/m.10342 type:complete len:390 (+) Transcript_9843:73-1242(+)
MKFTFGFLLIPLVTSLSSSSSSNSSNSSSNKLIRKPKNMDDPRLFGKVDKRILGTVLSQTAPPPPIPINSELEVKYGFHRLVEPVLQQIMTDLCSKTYENLNGFTTETITIQGVDNNDITLYIHTPTNITTTSTGSLPCIYHIHGGGMGMLRASDPMYITTRGTLATFGVIVIGVEFRNSSGLHGPHHFPAGLNDCMSGLQWIYQHKAERNISKIIVHGESGGGNLSLALCLKAKRDGLLHLIDGVFARCPFIFGKYASKDLPEWSLLPSLQENAGLTFSLDGLDLLASVYVAPGDDDKNPLAWPYWATVEDLIGLPPHFISVNDLDPLRDEGKAYYHKLLEAGVSAQLINVHGTLHALDTVAIDLLPHLFRSILSTVASFAKDIEKNF